MLAYHGNNSTRSGSWSTLIPQKFSKIPISIQHWMSVRVVQSHFPGYFCAEVNEIQRHFPCQVRVSYWCCSCFWCGICNARTIIVFIQQSRLIYGEHLRLHILSMRAFEKKYQPLSFYVSFSHITPSTYSLNTVYRIRTNTRKMLIIYLLTLRMCGILGFCSFLYN